MTPLFKHLRQHGDMLQAGGWAGEEGKGTGAGSQLRLALWGTKQLWGAGLGNYKWVLFMPSDGQRGQVIQATPLPQHRHPHILTLSYSLPICTPDPCRLAQNSKSISTERRESKRGHVLPQRINARLASQHIILRSQRETKL